MRTAREVSPSKDIWSLGCVFSEVLVWSVLGREALADYLELRRIATDNLKNTGSSGCFHDGEKVSSAVHDMHTRVLKRRPIITGLVPIIESMLIANPNDRPAAFTIRKSLIDSLDNAQRMMPDIFPDPFHLPGEDSLSSLPQPSRSPNPPPLFCLERAQTLPTTTQTQSSISQPQLNGPRIEGMSVVATTGPNMDSRHPSFFHPISPHPRVVQRRETTPASHYTGLPEPLRRQPRIAQPLPVTSERKVSANQTHDSHSNGVPLSPITSGPVEENVDSVVNYIHSPSMGAPSTKEPYATVEQVLNWKRVKKEKREKRRSWNGYPAPVSHHWLRMLRGKDQVRAMVAFLCSADLSRYL
jgi:hypothetical protein